MDVLPVGPLMPHVNTNISAVTKGAQMSSFHFLGVEIATIVLVVHPFWDSTDLEPPIA